eukprot:Gb_09571 [translate_table: standard]
MEEIDANGEHKVHVEEIQNDIHPEGLGLSSEYSGRVRNKSICHLIKRKFPCRVKPPCRKPDKRFFRGDVQEQEFQYGKAHCLSSYYSVFVARLAIMVMLAILIGLLTILTWHFTTVYTTKSIKSLAYGLRFELLQRPILRMWNILNSTVEITMAQVKLSEYVVGRFTPPVSHNQQVQIYEAMRHITWSLFASRKALNAITISYNNGHVQAFHRDHRNNNTFYIFSEPANTSVSALQNNDVPISPVPSWSDISPAGGHSAIWYREPLDPLTGEKKGPPKQIPPDDLINIAGISEIHDGAASWHVTVSKFTDSPLLSSALPVRHPTEGSIVAVVGVTTALSSVGQLMRELVDLHSGYMYLTSQEGYLLATSTNAPLLRNKTHGPNLMMAVESSDPIIRAGAEWLQNKYGNELSFNQEVHVENVVLGHQRYYIDSFFLNLKRLPLVGVIIIPRSYVMGVVDRRGYATLVILISASLCILVIGCVCILILTSGVSKEMKLRAELISHLDARRRAEASSNYKSQFLANMSHELRTPMAAVIGLLDILICDECLTSEQISTVSQIRRCSTALLRLLNNILDLSKVESGKLVLEEAEFDIGRELEGLMDMFSVQCIDHNIETVLDLADDMPRVVRGDSARVVQIFANLISNSMKFTSSGHIILRGWCENSMVNRKTDGSYENNKDSWFSKKLRFGSPDKRSALDQEKITLWFEVEDTGCGIDPSKWETVFESFEQADPSTTRTYGGTGLGLCIVRTLVNKMGGQIKVVRKEGPGTLMRLYLVFGVPAENSGQLSRHIRIEFEKENSMVLLALKGNTSRLTMSHWLKENGIRVCEASGWIEMTRTLSDAADMNNHLVTELSGNVQSENTVNHWSSINECGNKDFADDSVHHNKEQVLCSDFDRQLLKSLKLIVIIDASLLDLSTNTWKSQLSYLDKFRGRVKFAWLLNHDTPSHVKLELRRTGHPVMVNRPLYKSKLVHMLTAITGEQRLEQEKLSSDSASSKLEISTGFHSIRSTIHLPSAGLSELEVPEKESHKLALNVGVELTENTKTPSCDNGQKICENIYLARHNSVSSAKEKTGFLSYPVNYLSDIALPSEGLSKSKYKSLHKKIESSKMHTLKEGAHDTIDNKTCYDNLNGSMYADFDSGICNNVSPKNTDQSEFLVGNSSCKQESQVVDFRLASEEDKISWSQKSCAEISCIAETGEDTVGRILDPSSRRSSNMTELSRAGVNSTEFRYEPMSQPSMSSVNGKLHCINCSPISERIPSQPLRMPNSNGICKQNALEGLRILLAEDTPVLQRVATIMLEKMGATVVAVGDGLQAVDALNCMYNVGDSRKWTLKAEGNGSRSQFAYTDSPEFDLILMDCQMPKLDGYEATKAIRRTEEETCSHIPIVALTAHAMSSDEAKCLEVGMDAYLTKPIDCKLMVSTILSLTKRKS